MNEQPIGIFDSGVWGISIWKEINRLLPWENTIYLADSKNAPYGEKSDKEIVRLSIKNTEILLDQNCKMVVVACNTATTNAIQKLRNSFAVPFIGIEPAIKPAAIKSTSKAVGILATKGTLSSSQFHSTAENHASGIKIIEQEGTGLVSLIESGKVDSQETKGLLQNYLKPMLNAGIDHLVLGCTHYPHLIPILKELLPEHVKITDSGEAVARQTQSVLHKYNATNNSETLGSYRFYTNAEVFILKRFLKDVQEPKEISYLDF